MHLTSLRHCQYLPFNARSMMCMAMVMSVQHLEHMSAELEQSHHYSLSMMSPTLPARHVVLTYSISSHRHNLSCQCQTPVLFPEPGKLPASLYYVDWATSIKYQSVAIRAAMLPNMLIFYPHRKSGQREVKKPCNAKLSVKINSYTSRIYDTVTCIYLKQGLVNTYYHKYLFFSSSTEVYYN